VLYNVPGRTGVTITPETVRRLSQIPSIVGIKEASGSLDACSEILSNAPAVFSVVSGDDSLTLPIVAVGGHGVISVVSNLLPEAMVALTNAALSGDLSEARRIHRALLPLCRAMFLDNNPIAVKTAAGMMGLCSDELRLPLTPMSPANREVMVAILADWAATEAVAA